jgi:hypothetical protein
MERLRGTGYDRECSVRESTLRALNKLPQDTIIRLLQWQRWGVCEAGTADMCAVEGN